MLTRRKKRSTNKNNVNGLKRRRYFVFSHALQCIILSINYVISIIIRILIIFPLNLKMIIKNGWVASIVYSLGGY